MRVLKNILALLASQLGTWAITLALTLVVPSYLGPDRYGLYSFVQSYATFFGIGMVLGTGTYLTWRIAREPEAAPRLFFNTIIAQLPLALVCGIAAFIVVPALDPSPLVRELVLALVATQALSALAGTCIAVLAGFQIMRVPALINVLTMFVGAVLIIGSIHFGAGLVFFVLAGLLAQGLGFVILLAYTIRRVHILPRIDVRLWKAVVVGGLPFFSWSLVLLFYSQISISMLKIMGGNTMVGWYSAANRIVGIPIFLPSVVIIAILPALSQERSARSPRFREMASRSLRLVCLVSIPAAAGMILLADDITHLLHFPSSFTQVSPIIAVLGINIPLVGIDMVLGTVLIALGRQKAWAVVGVIAAIVNPCANLWAIPFTVAHFGNGAIGAAAVTMLTELVMFVGALVLRPRSIFTLWDVWYIVRCLLAAAVMVPAVLALSRGVGTGTLSAVAYGMIVYAMSAYTFQVIRNEDLHGLFALVAGRMGFGGLLRRVADGRVADDRQAYDAVRTQLRATDGGALTNPALAAVPGSVSAIRRRPRDMAPRPVAPYNAWQLSLADGGVQAAEPLEDGWITIVYEGEEADQEIAAIPARASQPDRRLIDQASHVGV